MGLLGRDEDVAGGVIRIRDAFFEALERCCLIGCLNKRDDEVFDGIKKLATWSASGWSVEVSEDVLAP